MVYDSDEIQGAFCIRTSPGGERAVYGRRVSEIEEFVTRSSFIN
jgi:hypothetical protein